MAEKTNSKTFLQVLQELGTYMRLTSGACLSSLLFGTGLVVSLYLASQYRGSNIQLLVNLSRTQQSSVQSSYEAANVGFSQSIFSSLPLLVLWAGVGLIAYWLGVTVIGTIVRSKQLQQEMQYVHADPNALVRQAAIKAIVRVVALALWVLYAQIMIHIFVPYVAALVSAGRGEAIALAIGYLVVAILLASLTWYVHIVFARLLFLRGRLFG